MRREVATCDICGKEIGRYSKLYRIEGVRWRNADMDICIDCLLKFKSFVEEAIDVSAREE